MAAADAQAKAAVAMQKEMVYAACGCCYQACNFADIYICCQGSGTCICCENKSCLAAGVPQFPIGMIEEEGFICKIGLPCCTYGLKQPNAKDLISSDQRCLCMRTVAQFPFGDKGNRLSAFLSFTQHLTPTTSPERLSLSFSLSLSLSLLSLSHTHTHIHTHTPAHSRACDCYPRAVGGPICAYCFLQCFPQVGCALPGPGGKSESGLTYNQQGGPDAVSMER